MDKLGEELFDLAYQEGKSVQECLYDVYNKGRADAIDEFANALINDGKVSAMRVLKIKEQLKEQS